MSKVAKNVSREFEGQREDEEVLYVFRRHLIAMRKGFYLLLGSLVITSVPFLIWQDNLMLVFLPIAGLCIGLLLFGYHYLMWYFTIFVLTNQRLRQVTQHGFFGKDVVELRLSKIQNISYNIPGFSGEVFGFGTIIIQTYVGDLVIHKADHPNEVYNRLQDAVSAVTEQEQL